MTRCATLTFLYCTGALGCGNGGSAGASPGPEAGAQDSATIVDSGVVADGGSEASNSDGGGAPGSDGSTGVDGGAAFEAGPGCPTMSLSPTCNVGLQCGPVVTLQSASGTAPTPVGGTISPGLYFLTEANIYGGSPGSPPETIQITMNLDSTGNYWVNSYDYGQQSTPSSGTFTAASEMFTRTPSCPAVSAPYSHGYTATATTLTLIEGGGSAGVVELVETKQ